MSSAHVRFEGSLVDVNRTCESLFPEVRDSHKNWHWGSLYCWPQAYSRPRRSVCSSAIPSRSTEPLSSRGDYKVEWEGSGSNVEVSIKQGKNGLANASAHQVEPDATASNNAVVTLTNDDGRSSLTGLRFEGKKFGQELGESTDGMQVGSSK
jgi:hypothetical protein